MATRIRSLATKLLKQLTLRRHNLVLPVLFGGMVVAQKCRQQRIMAEEITAPLKPTTFTAEAYE